MSSRPPKILAVAALVIAIPAAGCGSSSSSSSTATSTAAGSAAAGTVAVTLNEMNVIPTPATAKTGKVTFDVKNSGAIPHEMVVLKTDKKAADLGSGNTVPETGSVGETGDIAAGKSKTVAFNLKPGHYALICNIPGHYSAGMHADFNVS